MKKAGLVLGIGIDILQIDRFHRLLAKGNGDNMKYVRRLSARVLHPVHELPAFEQHWNKNDVNHCVKLIAGSWSAKEAVYKTLDPEIQKEFQFKNWYRHYNDRGKPFLGCDDYMPDEEFLLSVSHDYGIMVASVIRQRIIEI